MRLGFGKNSGNFYVAIDSNPNTVGFSYLRCNSYLVKIAMVTSDSVQPNTLTLVYVDQDWSCLIVKIAR